MEEATEEVHEEETFEEESETLTGTEEDSDTLTISEGDATE